MYFTKDDIKRIKEASKGKLLEVIGDFHELRKRGAEYKCECPKCHGQESYIFLRPNTYSNASAVRI